jgi:hypothetical protein
MKSRDMFVIFLLVANACVSQPSATSGNWLMIVPPVNSSGTPDTSQPLSKWQTIASLGSSRLFY